MALKYLHKKRLFRLINKYNLFDKDWYLFAYPDVANTKLDPYQHYYKNGIYENRNPNPLFSSQFYLDTYHDVRDAGVHPFYHYIFFGGADGSFSAVASSDWTSGFFPGSLWYLYEYTKDKKWETAARRWKRWGSPLPIASMRLRR